MKRLENKIALITGGNSGIGYATAQRFAQEGATVIITGRNAEKVQKAADELGVLGLVADQANLADAERLADEVKTRYGRVDVLFMNAGVFLPSPLGAIEEPIYDSIMDINFKGVVFTIERLLPLMAEGASIINLSSINAYMGMANASIYGASKAAMNSYTRAASTELAPRGIRINSVNPGPIETPIFGKTGMPAEMLEGFAAAIQQRVPLKRFGTPEAVAGLVAYLASDEAWFVTGAEYNIDGGMNVNPGPIAAAVPAEAAAN